MTGVTIVSRFIGFFCHLALGFLLIKEDFGLYAVAVSITALFACFQDTGIYKILVHKGKDFERFSEAGFLLSFVFNLCSAMLLIVAGIFYSKQIGQSNLFLMMLILAVTLVVASPISVFQAYLAKDLQFKSIAKISIVANTFHYIIMVFMAWLGCGVFSFVIPRIFSRIYELIAYWRASSGLRYWGFWERLLWANIRELSYGLPWVMLAALAIGIVVNGDYFVLGLMVDISIVGVYFFGFQLVTVFSGLVTSVFNQVAMPTFARINDDPERQVNAYYLSVRAILAISFPVCFATIIMVGPVIHQIWGGKWDQSIIVTQTLLLSLPIRFIPPISRAFLEARGKWNIVAIILCIDAIGIIGSAFIGGMISTLLAIVLAISIWRFCIGIFQAILVPYIVGGGGGIAFLSLFIRYLFFSSLPFLLIWIIQENVDFSLHALLESIIDFSIYLLVYSFTSYMFLRSEYGHIIKKILFRKKNPVRS